ncbi:MAG: peptidyl-prolyl cis-trans isomerase [Actinomycetota bacterium]|nr:peptidyl-prolyl cis-trans isomerase [Actinomycetota bacterium]
MRRAVALAAAALLVAPACGDLLDPAAAVVHGRKIPVEAVQRQLDAYVASPGFEQLAAQGDEGALKRQFEQGRLTDLIMRAVLTPAAAERGIEITDEDVRQRIEEFIEAEYEGNLAQYEEELHEQGLTEAQFHDIVHDRLLHDGLREKVVGDVEPTDEDVEEFYEQNRAEFETIRAQHVVVDDRALAQQLAARLQAAPAGEVDDLFASLARKHSTDRRSRTRGGDLGYQARAIFEADLGPEAVDLEEGVVSDPLRTRSGWHVVRVVDRRIAPLDQIRDQIVAQIEGPVQDAAWSEYLHDLFEEADVKVNSRYGVFDEELLQVVDADAEDVPAGEAPAPAGEPSPPGLPVPPPPG